MSFVLHRAASSIAGVGRTAVADVMDAHLEMLSMIFLTTLWAIGYGWVEGTIGIGHILSTTVGISWFGQYSLYHYFLGLTVFAISFSFGLLKFHRMLYYRKRYMLFTALGNYPYALVAQDFSYFWFITGPIRLDAAQWTCKGLSLGCYQLYNPWSQELYFFPRWYLVALIVSAIMFFLAYRSALVNLLVTREVMKQIGLVEKVRVASETVAKQPGEVLVAPPSTPTPVAMEAPQEQTPVKVEETRTQQKAVSIVDQEREELIRKLCERLERQ